ncbi:MAG: hypothetical protein OEW18_03005 [Candidatus Aminicenantes bacterium]|nr:hypothetical protein [Candidatus Aminicenantes bacterium]
MKLKCGPAVVCVSLACASLLLAQKPGRQLVPKAPDFVEVVNEERPQAPLVEVKFVLDLSLKQEGWMPHSLLVGKDGAIHAFSGKDNTLTRFDVAGRETLRKDFNSGQGPGEFGFFDPELAPDGRFVVLDARQRRITAFDQDFRLLGMSKINFWGDNFIFDSHSDMYLLVIKFLPGTTDRQLLVLTKCSAEAKPIREFYEYEWGLTRDARGIYHGDAYRTQVKYQVDSKDNLWYVATGQYEVNVVSPEGMLVRRIVKKGQTRKLTDGEIASFRPKDPRSRFVTDIPDRVPPIAGLFLLDQGLVLVVTFESHAEDRELVGDIFDAQGIYRGRVRLPKYDGWDSLMAPNKPLAKACGGFFYTVETPEDGEETLVRRYKILINRGS